MVAEQSCADAPSPAVVHSSTGAGGGDAREPRRGADPNEDWCAVCMDGGELMCCDKCPKVFHQYCHIPTIEKLPDESESWQCLLCVNFAEEEAGAAGGGALEGRARRVVERITLELYCQYELSLALRAPAPGRAACLDAIRRRLQPGAGGYASVAQFVADVRALFRGAPAPRLEEFFDAQLLKWLPEYAYWSGEGEPPAKRARSH